MRLAPTQTPRRSAFTLIELLVVMGIIALLVALLTASVMKAFARAYEVQNRNVVQQMSNALGAFKTKFGRYPPSRIRLCQSLSTYGNSPTPAAKGGPQLDQDSINFIHAMFPRCDAQWTSQNGIMWSQTGAWNGDSILEGEQCLVFFLGGIPVTTNGANGCVGFSTNPANPADLSASTRIGPFTQLDATHLTAGGGFFAYNDPYDQPYAYFSCYNARNGYNRYGQPFTNGALSDCNALGVWPYFDGASFYNPESFQIISAGANTKFGPGGQAASPNSIKAWTPATAGQIGPAGADDLSNFYDQQLGHAS